ncbi:competence/damage-inducible protein A [Synechococcales cyanobacterium C]|uniref:CinA-like protein n=1 Tax=Petrachloros mirabilis ULC683 TaxID=2781853 RepID=A0A8K2A890_9CYAN|nr:competence/damage-inducible protein A [Petrachloros mirabilis]NCJ07746.1 competence/damage-inducible protein A [Petrachloros mirabilis ULC683]
MAPSAEIICVGTELLLGEILNRNAQFLAQELARLGIPHYYQTVVGDNPVRMKRAIAVACQRSGLLIFTGGLGPTPDDLTTAVLADFFDAPLVERPEIWADITQKFAHRGLPPSESNRKQALLPRGAAILPNPTGSAPGLIWHPREGLTILTFPGVPREMHRMWQETAVPYLISQGYGQQPIYSQVLRFWGIPESVLAEKVAPFLDLTRPTVAPYAGEGEVRLRVSTVAASQAEAATWIDPVVAQIKAICGIHYYGCDDETLASVVGALLGEQGQTLAVAESCTGGGIGHQITVTPGSSAYFLGGIVAYDNSLKQALLGVEPQTLALEGAVSAAVAEQMAVGVRSRLHTTWGLSTTGIAGPEGGTPEKPVGLVYIGLAGPDGVQSLKCEFGAHRGRDWIRLVTVLTALDTVRRSLLSARAQG